VGVRPGPVRRVGPATDPVDAAADPPPPRRHRGLLEELVGAAPTLRRAAARTGAPQRGGAARPDLRPQRRGGRRTHHQPARGGRQRPHLGLPVHLGPRRVDDPAGPVRRRLPRRGRPVLRVPGPRRGHPARPRAGLADHVRGRRRAGSLRARGRAPGGLATQRTGPGRERGLEPAPARRVRLAARRRLHPAHPAGDPQRADPGVPRGRGGHRRGPLGRPRPGHLGDARPGTPLPAQQADVLGGAGPRLGHDRPTPRQRPGGGVDRGAGRGARLHPRARMEPAGRRLHPALRLRRSGRLGAAVGHCGVPAPGRPPTHRTAHASATQNWASPDSASPAQTRRQHPGPNKPRPKL